MYSQNDLDDAVRAGAISADSAAALRNFVDQRQPGSVIDEEQFRLITGFNDIFVAIASAILLFAVGWIGQSIGQRLGLVIDGDGPSPLAPAFIAATSWGLATFFTAKRRMALPSILLLLAFVGGVLAASMFSLVLMFGEDRLNHNETMMGLLAAVSAAVGAAGAWLHWRTFKVPITIAAGGAAMAGIAISIMVAIVGDTPSLRNILLVLTLCLGIGMFLFAMWWDSSDRARTTRRSDVAFWLHLLAAPMIVHPIFTLLGLNDGTATISEGLIVIVLYIVLGVTALAIDRRALLVSALAYVLYALSELFKQFGAVQLNIALTALVIGSALLLLSAYWHQARRVIVDRLPGDLRNKLPLLDRPVVIPQPAA
nr:hypothetical protein [uncultured Sphingomonas sp.]